MTTGSNVYTTPPLTIDEDDLARIAGAMVKIVAEWSARFGASD